MSSFRAACERLGIRFDVEVIGELVVVHLR